MQSYHRFWSNSFSVLKVGTQERLNKNGKLSSRTVISTFVISTNSDGMHVLDMERALKEVANVFAYMHSPIAKTSHCNNNELPVLSPREYLELRCEVP